MPLTIQVTDALSEDHFGVIACIPGTNFHHPIDVRWSMNDQMPYDLDIDGSGLCARRVPAGKTCVVTISKC